MTVLAAERVTKSFAGVRALDDVSIELSQGTVTCLLGDNGAGKSTLIGVLNGVGVPDAGRVLLDGREVRFRSPRDALGRGIATVHQTLALVPLMSVWRNFILGREPTRGRGPLRRLDTATARRTAVEQLQAFGIRMADPDRPVGSLSGGERQSVAIARALHSGARVLILDEPTAALGVRQSALVLDAIRHARERGIAVLFVSHNPVHALEVGDDFVVLRQGSALARFDRAEASLQRLVVAMSGIEGSG